MDFIQKSYTICTINWEFFLLATVAAISVSMAVIKDFSANYMKALELNEAYMLLKLRKNYYIVLICSFGSIS